MFPGCVMLELLCRRICGEGGDVGGCGCVIALSRTAMLMAIVLGNVMMGENSVVCGVLVGNV